MQWEFSKDYGIIVKGYAFNFFHFSLFLEDNFRKTEIWKLVFQKVIRRLKPAATGLYIVVYQW